MQLPATPSGSVKWSWATLESWYGDSRIGRTSPPARPLPDTTGVLAHHGLTLVAAKRLGEFRHVGNHVIDAVFVEWMRVHEQQSPHHFGSHIAAPDASIGQKKSLQLGYAIFPFARQSFSLGLQVRVQRRQRQVDAAIVGRILTLR